jgi:integrase
MNRLTPIQESIQRIAGYPSKLIVFKTNASRFYWSRVYFNSRYHVRSTKTENIREAKEFAVKFFEQVLVSAATTHTSHKSLSFAAVGRAFLKAQQENANESTHRNDEARFKNDLLPFFAEQDVSTITNAQISQFIERLKKRDLSTATLKHFLVILRKILKFAVENDLMQRLPLFPKVSGRLKTAQRRDYLTYDEYTKIVATAERLAKQNTIVRGVPLTLEMKYLIQFMVNTFIRPSDLKVIKFQHLHHRKEGADEWMALTHPATKTNANEVQAMPATVGIVQKLTEFKKQSTQKPTKDSFVFFSEYENRQTAIEVIARLFRKIAEESDIPKATGKNLTLYSLRHTSIMLRLVKGNVDTLVLARNARTSQQMIDKFYAAHLTTDQVRKQLHAFIDDQKVLKKTPAKRTTK